MTRTFIAVELPDNVRAFLTRAIARLRRALPSVRWVDPASLHLTLAFLGELDDDALAAAMTATEEEASKGTPFTLRTGTLGTFGPRHVPRVIWIGVEGETAHVRALQEALAQRLEAAGFPREQRPFSPHLTLARLKSPLAPEALTRLEALMHEPQHEHASWRVNEISVMKSELGRGGARYIRLQAYPLGHSS
ncbi:MAG TPA: RNA 2',3'-cyclic phosphodiesterase [Ktedonobacterales bacterium]|nr:RNA 2',3'-cyclic phosphodiesterase [Ktedonobacterales bacterium]